MRRALCAVPRPPSPCTPPDACTKMPVWFDARVISPALQTHLVHRPHYVCVCVCICTHTHTLSLSLSHTHTHIYMLNTHNVCVCVCRTKSPAPTGRTAVTHTPRVCPVFLFQASGLYALFFLFLLPSSFPLPRNPLNLQASGFSPPFLFPLHLL